MLDSFNNISVFVFDMDGVLTDGSLFIMNNGMQVRKMNVKDGYALQLAVKKEYRIFVISAGYSPESEDRLAKLGVTNVFMQAHDKLQVLKNFIEQFNLKKEEILYMGDDIPDYEAMQYCGLSCCPADAVAEIKSISKYISPIKGGEGCVRDVIEKVMKLQGKWFLDTHTPSV